MPAVPVDSVQRITAAVTPAVMVSACGLIALGLDNQIARVSGRLRDLAHEVRDPNRRPSEPKVELTEQIRILDRRHALYSTAILLDYAALLAFVLTSLLYLLQRSINVATIAPLLAFAVGVVLLGVMSVYVLASLRLARSALTLEEHRALRFQEA